MLLKWLFWCLPQTAGPGIGVIHIGLREHRSRLDRLKKIGAF